jgi:hypothetical protein
MSDISLAVGDDARRMTCAELAQARGISLAYARPSAAEVSSERDPIRCPLGQQASRCCAKSC